MAAAAALVHVLVVLHTVKVVMVWLETCLITLVGQELGHSRSEHLLLGLALLIRLIAAHHHHVLFVDADVVHRIILIRWLENQVHRVVTLIVLVHAVSILVYHTIIES